MPPSLYDHLDSNSDDNIVSNANLQKKEEEFDYAEHINSLSSLLELEDPEVATLSLDDESGDSNSLDAILDSHNSEYDEGSEINEEEVGPEDLEAQLQDMNEDEKEAFFEEHNPQDLIADKHLGFVFDHAEEFDDFEVNHNTTRSLIDQHFNDPQIIGSLIMAVAEDQNLSDMTLSYLDRKLDIEQGSLAAVMQDYAKLFGSLKLHIAQGNEYALSDVSIAKISQLAERTAINNSEMYSASDIEQYRT